MERISTSMDEMIKKILNAFPVMKISHLYKNTFGKKANNTLCGWLILHFWDT